jgi:hypothetical protein
MSKFKVITPVTGNIIEYVEADSWDDALEKVKEGKDVINSETVYDIEDYDYDMSDGECVE